MGQSQAKLLVLQPLVAKGVIQDDMPLWALSVIEYLPWETRAELSVLCRSFRSNTNTSAYHRFLCQRLAIENGIYVPHTPLHGLTWRTLFLELFKLRNLWTGSTSTTDGNEKGERSKIGVYVKFRPVLAPKEGEESAAAATEEQGITLPLHQKLAMIRMSHRTTSNRQALKLLAQEGGWFSKKWSTLDTPTKTEETENNENISSSTQQANRISPVSVAFTTDDGAKKNKHMLGGLRPSQQQTLSTTAAGTNKMISKVHSLDPLTGRVVMLTPDVGLREFSFDGVLPAKCSQRLAYETSTRHLVVDLLNGFNATAIVYGQTGSGKTYTMFGDDDRNDTRGIVPRACEEILSAMQTRREVNGIDSTLSVSYVEVYGDSVSDLLRYGARCGHAKASAQRYVLNGAAEQVVHSLSDIQHVLEIGEQQKRCAATAMNDRSTRAHSLFILTLSQRHPSNGMSLRTRLFLADLGGSEQVKKSQVEAGVVRTAGAQQQFSLGFELAEHMREAVYINLGLLALKKCIEALNNHMLYIPFQDSKLTMLLSEGLGGSCKTSVIVCANLDPVQAVETVATLRFGERCAMVELSARNNATMLAGILEDLDRRISTLEEAIQQKERWELHEMSRADALAEDGTLEKALGGTEVIKKYIVLGAEAERRELGELLIQRMQFTGAMAATGKEKMAMAFGKQYAELYGLGGQFDASAEETHENARFTVITEDAALPTVIRQKKGATTSWAVGEMVQKEEDGEQFARGLRKANKKRNKLAYSGISA
jgi:hypothetical protein